MILNLHAAVPCLLAETTTVADWLPTFAMIGAVLILGLVLAGSFNRRERQLRALASQVSSDLEEAKSLRTQLDDAHTLASNMMVTAQRLSARLDERVAALDLASLRMNATRNALPRAKVQAASPARVPESESPSKAVSLSPVLSSIENAMSPPRVSPALPTAASLELKPPQDELTRRVYSLADSGHSAVAIARDCNEQVGKIELILALRR